MKTIVLEFSKRVATGVKNGLNDPEYADVTFSISDCLVAPAAEPLDRVESAALDRNMSILRVHLPKSDSSSVANCKFNYGGREWTVLGDPVPFMNDNTPTMWNRYLRAESIDG